MPHVQSCFLDKRHHDTNKSQLDSVSQVSLEQIKTKIHEIITKSSVSKFRFLKPYRFVYFILKIRGICRNKVRF